MLRKTGVPTDDLLRQVTPSEERLRRGPVAIFECFERIPCDPCQHACPTGAVQPFEDLNDLPRVDHQLCTGCGRCIQACPGLAVFVVQEDLDECSALVGLPYEYCPLPAPGDVVTLLDRQGRAVGQGRIKKVVRPGNRGETPVVWVIVPRGLAMTVRHIRPEGENRGADQPTGGHHLPV